ncbi:MAG: molybdate ABC transporter substrate-binding protein [Archangiaceae bacterium]|nr:molybdate ABC transporter substrate-binding protein [Archangiaceae bacterium]
MRGLVLVVVLGWCGCQKGQVDAGAGAPLRIAAAADLSRAFEELGQKLQPAPVFTFGASGLLARQLSEGAPFDVFAAANVGFVEQAHQAGACDAAQPFARGRLAVWSKAGGVGLEQLGDEKLTRIAIANPEVAPYGKAAKEALLAAGLWEKVEKRLVYGENVRQALQLAKTGNVEAALVADALVAGEKEAVVVDAARHQPLVQALAVCSHGGNRAGGEAFAKLVRSVEGQAVLEKYGFEPPP